GGRGVLLPRMLPMARRFLVTDSFDARQNIFAGTRYLRILLDTYGGDVSLCAAAYNAGEGAVARYNGIPPFPETQNYVRKVNALLGGAADALASAAPAIFIAQGERTAPKAPVSQAAAPVVKRPSVYYRW